MRRDFAAQAGAFASDPSQASRFEAAALVDTAPIPPRFRVALHRAKGGYVAAVRELPGCSGSGTTEVEAVERARAAIRAHLALAAAIAGEAALVELEIAP
jgi:predicted RNase H-like HicB family nuclease